MDYALVLILAVVQGITEFLPVSSSGHLLVLGELYQSATGQSVPDPVQLNVVLHAGTLLAILLFFWRRIARLVGQDCRVLGLLLVGTIPLAVVGVPLRLWGGPLLCSPLLSGAMLTVTGALLLWAARHPPGDCVYQQLSYRQALVIGAFQAVALLPGISRSGSTIAAGLALGLQREAAATFSFLLAIPAILGACAFELLRPLDAGSYALIHATPLMLGAATSLLVGLLSLWWLVRWLNRGRVQYFACWCIPLGLLVVVWQLAT